MPTFDILKETMPNKTFRVASIMGKFDIQNEHIRERFAGSIDINNDWKIGLIVGKSGTGKTTIAKQLFNENYISQFNYSNNSILDDMPQNRTIEEISMAFNSVGFSSPPSWLKSYNILSNGEKMRCDLARAILSENELFVFDEFTSVVDRQVAQIGSFAIQKAIRKSNKKFIAVTCHFDVIDWLLPDWIFNTDSMTFQKYEGQKKNRPDIRFEIYSTKDKEIWKMFSRYHYLSQNHNNAADCYVSLINEQISGFISVLHFPHPNIKNIKKVQRLVVLPDYQGVGFGIKLLEKVGLKYINEGYRYTITTSQPQLIRPLCKSNKWICTRTGRTGRTGMKSLDNSISGINRITTSFEFKS